MTEERRTIELEIEIDADPETVWTAISDAEQLRRWFPLDADVEPGEGGSITLSWGPDTEGTAPIDLWEPGRRLRWVEVEGEQDGEPIRVAVDFTIEGRGGTTRLRLVHSGFSADADWDDYVDTIDSGWRYFLYNLRHYVENHWGEPRTMVWERREVQGPKERMWSRLLSLYGLDPDTPAAAGDPAELWNGAAAEVVMAAPPKHLALRIPELGDALLLVEQEPGGEEYSLGTWLSLYGDAGEKAPGLEDRLRTIYDRDLD